MYKCVLYASAAYMQVRIIHEKIFNMQFFDRFTKTIYDRCKNDNLIFFFFYRHTGWLSVYSMILDFDTSTSISI